MTSTFKDPHIECRNEADILEGVYYKNKSFTGTIINGLETINYKNGCVHGAYTTHYSTGALKRVENYDNGDLIAYINYYPKGRKESELRDGSYYKWTPKGILYQKDNCYYF
ncbi:MAG: hypothetical protein ABJQ39_05875 [Winogradskyella arenosi]